MSNHSALRSSAAFMVLSLACGAFAAIGPNNDLNIVNAHVFATGGPHPFHLHGHAFSVVKSAGQRKPNYVNPMRRDIVSTGTGTDNVTIRFTTDNSGPYFLHCRIEAHLMAGLAVVFAEDVTLRSTILFLVATGIVRGCRADRTHAEAGSDLCPEFEASLKAKD